MLPNNRLGYTNKKFKEKLSIVIIFRIFLLKQFLSNSRSTQLAKQFHIIASLFLYLSCVLSSFIYKNRTLNFFRTFFLKQLPWVVDASGHYKLIKSEESGNDSKRINIKEDSTKGNAICIKDQSALDSDCFLQMEIDTVLRSWFNTASLLPVQFFPRYQ